MPQVVQMGKLRPERRGFLSKPQMNATWLAVAFPLPAPNSRLSLGKVKVQIRMAGCSGGCGKAPHVYLGDFLGLLGPGPDISWFQPCSRLNLAPSSPLPTGPQVLQRV